MKRSEIHSDFRDLHILDIGPGQLLDVMGAHADADDQQQQQHLIFLATNGARGTPLDTYETLRQINTVVNAESSAQKLFAVRISQTQDFNRNLASIESGKRAEVDMFVEGNLESECAKQELWQVRGQQLLKESWDRLKSLHALKNHQNAKGGVVHMQSSSQLASSIASAEHHELQIIEDIVYEKICAEDQQKRLKELDEKHHHSVLAIREEQHDVFLEHLKSMREERDKLLDEWVDSRKQLLEHLEEIKTNTRNTTLMIEEEKHCKERQEGQHMANMAAMVRIFQEVNNQPASNKKPTTTTTATTMTTTTTTNSSQGSGSCDCSICFEELDSGNNNNTTATSVDSRGLPAHVGGESSSAAKKRACFRPCNHATVCLDCAVRIWRDTKTCPLCKATLTTKPEAIYL